MGRRAASKSINWARSRECLEALGHRRTLRSFKNLLFETRWVPWRRKGPHSVSFCYLVTLSVKHGWKNTCRRARASCHTCMHAHTHIPIHPNTPISIHTHIHIYSTHMMHAYIHTYKHIYQLLYLPTNIPSYLLTYLPAWLSIDKCARTHIHMWYSFCTVVCCLTFHFMYW